jgi:monofunctional glycosyltransferase
MQEPPDTDPPKDASGLSKAEETPAPPPRRKRRILKALTIAVVIVLGAPLIPVLVYRFVPVPVTPLMLARAADGKGMDHRWKPLSEISPNLVRAVVAAEDARFCEHHGFDFEAIEKAIENNRRRPDRIRGASTISQQTAKNVFLWEGRSYLRKGLEVYFTVLIEAVWGKRRIMEVYLNSIEWGPGIYGAEAAAQRTFKVPARRLTVTQSARLAAILPSPLRWRAARPGPYVAQRSRRIGAASGTVRRDGLDGCI